MARGARRALLAALAIGWLNFLTTSRWAAVPGALHGWRAPWIIAALGVSSVLAMVAGRRPSSPLGVTASRVVLGLSASLLLGALCWWFPPSAWTRIPLPDDWPPRYQSTIETIDLLRHATVSGWQWFYLGGYHMSSDITQNLGVLGWLPMTVLGPRAGFHLLQLLLFFAVPAIVYLDLRNETPRAWAPLAAGLACLVAWNLSYMFVRSGDTNSVAGLACTALVIVASRASREGARWGWPALVLSVVLTAYSHAGFVMYAFVFVLLDAACARDARTVWRGLAAFAIGGLASLPSAWELLRYPSYFNFNNVVYDRESAQAVTPLIRKIYYNVELLWLPGRWNNDYTGLTAVFLPVIGYVAWRERRTRAGFYAAGAIVAELMLRLNAPQFGYVFIRPMHMLAFFTAPVIAWFLVRAVTDRRLAWSVVALVAIYIQIVFPRIPHIDSVRDFNAPLVDRIAQADGALVLLENNPHRDMDADPSTSSAPSAFGIHYEALVGTATGRRLYAGYWDGWQWCPWRGQTLAGGTLLGRRVDRLPATRFDEEMRRWGIRHLFVWSDVSVAYLRGRGFQEVWQSDRWHEFRVDSDGRDVVTSSGTARLTGLHALGADIVLHGVDVGSEVVVRMNYHPAWTLWNDGVEIPVYDRNGQLAFKAGLRDGTVRLAYPRRRWLAALASAALVAGLLIGPWLPRTRAVVTSGETGSSPA
jgi:hypothetical protein